MFHLNSPLVRSRSFVIRNRESLTPKKTEGLSALRGFTWWMVVCIQFRLFLIPSEMTPRVLTPRPRRGHRKIPTQSKPPPPLPPPTPNTPHQQNISCSPHHLSL